MPGEDETIDAILDGRIKVIQTKGGYRFSLDALLLAYFAQPREGDRLLDLGTGSGVVALILAARYRCRQVLGIELQEGLLAMAERSVALNSLGECLVVAPGDVRRPETFCAPSSFDEVVFNPPYRRLRSGRMNPHPEKAMARHEVTGTAGDFLRAAAFSLREQGRVTAVYPATRLVELLTQMRVCGLEPKRLQVVHSLPNGRGEFVLLSGVKGGREALQVLPPLYVYNRQRRYSEEMIAIFRTLAAFPGGAGA